MPKYLIDYSKTIFYKIVCKDPTIDDFYIGHTTNLTQRKMCHKYAYSNETMRGHKCYLYTFMKLNGGWDNFDFVVIEECECVNKINAKQIERKYIEELKPTLNRNVPLRTGKEYYDENKKEVLRKMKVFRDTHKELIRNRKKDYAIRNAEKIREKQKQTYTCECGVCLTRCHKNRHEQSIQHQNYIQSLTSQL